MTQTLAIAESITTLDEVEALLNLHQRDDLPFLHKWFEELPSLSDVEKAALDRIRQRYLFHQKKGSLSEGIVQIVAVTPLLDLAGLCDPPFLIHTEEPVRIQIEDEDMILNGRIDIVVIQNQMWVLVVEEKRGGLNSSVAIPQALTYMAATPNRDRPIFGMVTNGEDYQFIKLYRPEYGLSNKFTLMSAHNEGLYTVLQILKRLARAIAHIGNSDKIEG